MSREARFWARADKSGDCWSWTGARNPLGYGVAGHAKAPDRDRLTHRYSWQVTYGAIPDGLRVLHHCDNPSCVRPDHLFLGTIADNNRDRSIKGRSNKGETHIHAKLKEADVVAMREAAKLGESHRRLALRFGVSRGHVYRILNGIDWRQVA